MKSLDITDDIEDGDLITDDELDHYFNSKCSYLAQKEIDSSTYVLHISGKIQNDFNFIVGCSNSTVQIYNVINNDFACIDSLKTNSNVIGVKACEDNSNLYYIGTDNCEINLKDVRQEGFVTKFYDSTNTDGQPRKVLNCFDVSPNNLLLSGGTDLHDGDAYILFWDIRRSNLMGAYWESHTDDITQVQFHQNDMNKLISGSTDGLINVYNLSENNEDDALTDCLNTELSVQKLTWYKDNGSDCICCFTHTDVLQLWKLDDAAPYVDLRRNELAKKIQRKIEDYVYVADAFVAEDDKISILAGSNYDNSECLRGFRLEKKNLIPAVNFKGNRQKVRCCWFNHANNLFITGGEVGILNLWKL